MDQRTNQPTTRLLELLRAAKKVKETPMLTSIYLKNSLGKITKSIRNHNLLQGTTNPHMSEVQGRLSQLIYRYLDSGGGEEGQEKEEDVDQRKPLLEEADRKTRLLLSLLQDIHVSAHIMQHRSVRLGSNSTGHCSFALPLSNRVPPAFWRVPPAYWKTPHTQ